MSTEMNGVSYVGLDDAPGVGQADVSFSPEELQAFLQVALCMQINLEQAVKKSTFTQE